VSSGTETACDSKRVKSGQDAREPPTRCRRSREEPRCDLFGKATYVSCWLRFRFASITPSKPQSESSSISCIATTLGLLAMTSAAKSAGRLSPTSRLPRAINTSRIVMRSSSPKRSPRSKLKPLKRSTFSASSKLPRFRRHSLIHLITWAPTDRLPRNLTPFSGKCCKTPARLVLEMVAIFPHENGIVLQKLRYPAEVRAIEAVPELDGAQKIDKKELSLATSLVEQMITSFSDIDTVDHYHEALRKLIESKIKGKKVTEFEKVEEVPRLDIMTALKKSLQASQRKPMVKAEPAAKKKAALTLVKSKPAAQRKRKAS